MSYNNETGKYEGFIYMITNSVNGKLYIGQTIKTISERMFEHIWDSYNKTDDGMALHRAIAKYGKENFTIKELCSISCDDKKELRRLLDVAEIEYIDEYGSMVPEGYNVTPGGYCVAPDRCLKIFCFTMDGNLVDVFESLAEAERVTGIKHSCISRAVNQTDRQSAGGYLWSRTDNPPQYTIDFGSDKRKRVAQLNFDGEVIREWDSITLAARTLGLQQSLIGNCCKGKRKSTGGFRWAYLD